MVLSAGRLRHGSLAPLEGAGEVKLAQG